jgi:AGCS family alanine or glycine:cation symporter
VVFMVMAVIGSTVSLGSLIDFADSLLFLMAIPNLVGVYLLMPVVKRGLSSYLARLKSGEIRQAAGWSR